MRASSQLEPLLFPVFFLLGASALLALFLLLWFIPVSTGWLVGILIVVLTNVGIGAWLYQTSKKNTRYALAIEAGNNGVLDWNLQTREIYLSAQLKEMAGYRDEELPNEISSWKKLIHPDDQVGVLREFKIHSAGKRERFRKEFRMIHKDGSIVWILGQGEGRRNKKGKVVRMTGSYTDITYRKQLENSLKGVLNSSLSGIMAFQSVRDQTGKIIDFEWTIANRMASEIVGIPAEKLIGQRLLVLMPGNKEEGLFDKYSQVVETGISIEFEQFYAQELSQGIWFEISVIKQGDGFVVTFSNITERKQRDKEKDILSLVASKTEAAVVITDRHQRIEWVNEGYCSLTKYSLAEVKGKKAGSFMKGPNSNLETSRMIGDQLRSGLSVSGELLNYRKDGSQYWVVLNISPIYEEGEIVRFIAVETDISARKEAELALIQAKEAAEQAAEAKTNFLATMSHEIRTPMNAVIGMTELLQETELDDEQREYVETVRLSGNNLLTIINDILDFSKIDAGKMELEAQAFQAQIAIEDVLDLLSGKAHKQGIELFYDIDPAVPPFIEGDPTRLNQVLVNLVNNAIKFTEAGEVIVFVKPGQADMLEFQVKDTGIGISEDQVSRLFLPFSQVDASTTRKYGGTGLGLIISRKLVELMGGEIWVKSKEGVGSTFGFSIQAKAVAPPIESETPPFLSSEELHKKLVLLVDDNLTNLRLLSKILTNKGVRTISTNKPTETLDLLQAHPDISAIILDMQMPDIDGLSLATNIKKQPEFAAIPLLLLTSMHELPSKAAQVFFDAMLHKPVRQERFLRQLCSLICSHDSSEGIPFPRTPATEMPSMPKISILLVEDNLINQKVALRMLSKLGYDAEVAANGLEAIKMLELRPFDLVFMDMQMPEMDGLTATREIRKHWKDHAHRPTIIAMTANALKTDRDRCLESGMDDYLTKPIKKGDISKAILKWFGQVDQQIHS